MTYQPLMIQLQHKSVVVIGGGKIAERKVLSLLYSKPNITIISPSLTKPLATLADNQVIHWHNKHYERTDCLDALFVIAATNDPTLNENIINDCKPYQLTLNISNHQASNTIMPALIRRDNIQIAISTNGSSPIIAKKIRDKINELINTDLDDALQEISAKRKDIIRTETDPLIKQNKIASLVQSIQI